MEGELLREPVTKPNEKRGPTHALASSPDGVRQRPDLDVDAHPQSRFDSHGGGRALRFERPELGALVTAPRDRRIAERWVLSGTRLRGLLLGTPWGDHVVWDRPTRAVGVAVDAGGVTGLALTLVRSGAGSDDPHAVGGTIRRSPDLLAGALDGVLLGGLTEDAGRPGEGLAFGLTRGENTTTSVVGGEQRVSGPDGVYSSVEHVRALPVPGLGVWVEGVVGGPDGTSPAGYDPTNVVVELAALSPAGAVLAQSSQDAIVAGAASGQVGPAAVVAHLALPAATQSVRLRLRVYNQPGASGIALSTVRLLTCAPPPPLPPLVADATAYRTSRDAHGNLVLTPDAEASPTTAYRDSDGNLVLSDADGDAALFRDGAGNLVIRTP